MSVFLYHPSTRIPFAADPRFNFSNPLGVDVRNRARIIDLIALPLYAPITLRMSPEIDPQFFSARISRPAPVAVRDFRPREAVGDGHINFPNARRASDSSPAWIDPRPRAIVGIDSRFRERVGKRH